MGQNISENTPLLNKTETITLMEGGNVVYVIRNPSMKLSEHTINILNSGAFEVICCHEKFDEDVIREQVRQKLKHIKND